MRRASAWRPRWRPSRVSSHARRGRSREVDRRGGPGWIVRNGPALRKRRAGVDGRAEPVRRGLARGSGAGAGARPRRRRGTQRGLAGTRGWQVTAVDFPPSGWTSAGARGVAVDWERAVVLGYQPEVAVVPARARRLPAASHARAGPHAVQRPGRARARGRAACGGPRRDQPDRGHRWRGSGGALHAGVRHPIPRGLTVLRAERVRRPVGGTAADGAGPVVMRWTPCPRGPGLTQGDGRRAGSKAGRGRRSRRWRRPRFSQCCLRAGW